MIVKYIIFKYNLNKWFIQKYKTLNMFTKFIIWKVQSKLRENALKKQPIHKVWFLDRHETIISKYDKSINSLWITNFYNQLWMS